MVVAGADQPSGKHKGGVLGGSCRTRLVAIVIVAPTSRENQAKHRQIGGTNFRPGSLAHTLVPPTSLSPPLESSRQDAGSPWRNAGCISFTSPTERNWRFFETLGYRCRLTEFLQAREWRCG